MVKKVVISLTLGALLLGIGLWAGLTWLFGTGAEAALAKTDYLPKAGDDEDGIELFHAAGSDYERGFFSSTGKTYLALPGAEDDDGDGLPDSRISFRHQIYHGPLAFTPDGVIPCSNYVVTTFDLEQLPEEGRTAVLDTFLGQPPLVVRTITGIDRSVTSRITVSPFSIESSLLESKTKFDGLDATFTVVGDEDSLRSITGDATLGGWQVTTAEGSFEGAPGSGEIDFQDGQHLKGHLTLGAVTGSVASMEGRIGEIKLAFDQVQAGDSIPYFLGTSRLHFEELRFAVEGEDLAIKDGEIVVESGSTNDQIHGLVRYGIGGVTVPTVLAGPALPFLPAFEKGFSLEIGGRGIPQSGFERVMEKAQSMQQLQMQALGSGLSGDFEDAGEAPEYAAAMSEYLQEFIGLIRPGAEIYQRFEIRGESGESHAELTVGITGEKSLTEMATVGEVMTALAGEASIKVSKVDLPPDQVAAMTEGLTAAGFLQETATDIIGKARLADGVLHLNGEPTPILESMGPQLEAPIPWEDIFSSATAAAMQ